MFTLTIQGATAKELNEKLQQIAFGFSPAPAQATKDVTIVDPEHVAVKPKKKGCPSKVETVTEEVEAKPAQEIVAKAAVADESEFMKVKTRCLEVAKIKGRAALETLLDKFSVKRITELSGDQYDAVLEAVEKVLKG